MNLTTQRVRGVLLLAPIALALAACEGLGLGGEPENLRVEVETEAGVDVVLVTSPDFIFQEDPACENTEGQSCPEVLRLLSADTVLLSPPVQENIPFTQTLQYYVEVFPASASTTVTLRVYIDGRPWSNETRILNLPADSTVERETLQFVYQYQRARLP